MGKIVKVSEGAFFVPSYSIQTIFRAYETGLTFQSLNAGEDDSERESERNRAPEITEPAI